MHHKTHSSTKHMVLIGLSSALLCVLSPFSITLPLSPVPFTLGTLAVYMTTYILGLKKGLCSFLLYLLLGFVGLPVFAGFTSGPGRILGPTGGYLLGEILLILILGFLLDSFKYKQPIFLCGLLLGTLVCYLFGSLWLSHVNRISFTASISIGVIPYLPLDALKIAFAFLSAPQIRARLSRAKLL